jgi:DNA-binding NarL/FixJ family response regulator
MIEDDPVDAKKFVRLLRKKFKIVTEMTLESALERLDKEKFDAILLDLALPDSPSPQETFCRVWDAVEAPIVVLTSMSDEFGVEMVRRGAQDYLLKTETSDSLCVRAVLYAVERYRLVKRIQELQEEQSLIFRRIREKAEKKLEEYDHA